MGKNSGSHVIKDNTICDIRAYVFITVGKELRERDVCVGGRWVLTRVGAPRGRGVGNSPDLKRQDWLKDFFGFEIFDSGIFLGRKIWQVFLFWRETKITSILAGDSSYRYQG